LPDPPGRYPMPWITQYATPSLIAAIAYRGHPPADDPAWRQSGAPDQETYGRWCTRLCGMACLRMALALSSPSREAPHTRTPYSARR
jgi:hypothetical protein